MIIVGDKLEKEKSMQNRYDIIIKERAGERLLLEKITKKRKILYKKVTAIIILASSSYI